MTQQLVFDVNETLLDVSALDPLFERLFNDASTRQISRPVNPAPWQRKGSEYRPVIS